MPSASRAVRILLAFCCSAALNAAFAADKVGGCYIIPNTICPHAELANGAMSGANLSGADLRGAILCGTIMPDGSVNSSGCTADGQRWQ